MKQLFAGLWLTATVGLAGPQIFSAQSMIPSFKNEDVCATFHAIGNSDNHLFVVCDGHQGDFQPGEGNAQQAAQFVVDQVGQRIAGLLSHENSIDEQKIVDMVSALDSEMAGFAHAGTTLSALLINKNQLNFFAVGDSLQVVSKNGTAYQPIFPHEVENELERARIPTDWDNPLGPWFMRRGCFRHDTRNKSGRDWQCRRSGTHQYVEALVLRPSGQDELTTFRYTRSLGDKAFKFKASPIIATPEIKIMTLDESIEFIILATDGVFETVVEKPLTPQAAVTMVRRILLEYGISQTSVQKAADWLTTEASFRYGGDTADDITAVIIAFQR